MSTLTLPNPWEKANWNLTAQGRFIREHGLGIATLYARAAGVEIGATKPAPDAPAPKIEQRNFIRNKIFEGGGNRGYAGDGPPED